jgi:hypothetical protein
VAVASLEVVRPGAVSVGKRGVSVSVGVGPLRISRGADEDVPLVVDLWWVVGDLRLVAS